MSDVRDILHISMLGGVYYAKRLPVNAHVMSSNLIWNSFPETYYIARQKLRRVFVFLDTRGQHEAFNELKKMYLIMNMMHN